MTSSSKCLQYIAKLMLLSMFCIFTSDAHDEWGGNVVTLTEQNFDKKVLDSDEIWLVCFYAPWCGHCKRLQPEFEEASRRIKKEKLPNIKLGAIDANEYQSYAHKYGIQGFPTLLQFPAGVKTRADAKPFQGDRSADAIVQWARNMAAEFKPPPEVVQLISEKVLKDNCEEAQICVLSFLPPLYDCQSKCRNRYIDRLKEIAGTFKSKPWGFLWVEANSQKDLEKTLEIGGFGYPALVAVNIRKKAYSVMKGSFSKEGITDFLKGLSYGQGSSAPIKDSTLPHIKKVELWDGKDLELPNLSDEL